MQLELPFDRAPGFRLPSQEEQAVLLEAPVWPRIGSELMEGGFTQEYLIDLFEDKYVSSSRFPFWETFEFWMGPRRHEPLPTPPQKTQTTSAKVYVNLDDATPANTDWVSPKIFFVHHPMQIRASYIKRKNPSPKDFKSTAHG
ncbi:hypothetical protein H6P81_007547 [Aristolochia fimbriata]|uniref:Uncharacterized protein n=1 Tax=Aristolochia fimbriata TaxID=158543 RepID=A0AAV7F0S5_ARIFI|nr:hypothetical protein H6P81_007547 [Aristolochia fimbriata]